MLQHNRPFIDNLHVFPFNKARHFRFPSQHGRHELTDNLLLHFVTMCNVPFLQPQLALSAEENHKLHLQYNKVVSDKDIVTAYSVLLKEILFIWMNIHSFYCIKQWSAHTLNLQILFGVHQTRRYQRDRKSPEKIYKTDNQTKK